MRMQIIDVDYIFNGSKPVIRIFGKTENGNSVCVMYDKFLPYFYAKIDTTEKLKKLQDIKEIKSADQTEMFTPLGYAAQPMELVKITVLNPQDVPKIRELIEQEGMETFESDIMFKYRFMVDHKLKGMQWIDVNATRSLATTVKIPGYYANSLEPTEKIENASLKTMAVDIECLLTDSTKPMDSKRDPIIMIAMAFEPEFKGKKTLVLTAKPTKEADTLGFQDEKEMLSEFLKIIDEYDPDVLTGYNINGFDMPYMFDRLKKFNLPNTFGRCKNKGAYTRSVGMQESKETSVPGRIVADSYQIIKRDPWVKFHRYNLNTIAQKLLQEQKHDVSFKEMFGLWNGDRNDLKRFIEYARKDAELALRLLTEKGLLGKFFELSKISGLLVQDCLGGQAPRVEMMLLHEFKTKGFVMPSKPSKAEMIKRSKEREKKELKGATVLEPYKGLHADGCVLVLDFKSLYPNIMRTYNISPDTLLKTEQNLEHTESPTGTKFVVPAVREGILPHLLRRLLDARANARKEMKSSQGETRRILNAKQLAIKDLSNSVYGYTGYIRARLYMIDVANSITAYGRENLVKTKGLIEDSTKFKIIYADTDSTFIKTDFTNLEEAKEAGEAIGSFVTKNLPGDLELQFEKIYKSFLILSKKRYAGWCFVHENGEWKDIIEMKGIETVRRDWCALVSESMEDVLKTILKEGDVHKAIASIKDIAEKIKTGSVPLEKLTIVKGITKSPENYEGMLPHIELAKKLKLRNPHEPPKIGDRLGFVIIKGNQLLSKRAEDPDYVIANKLQIDSDYYIQSQLFPPLERIFSSMGIEKSEIFGGGRQITLGEIMKGFVKKHAVVEPDNVIEGWENFVCKKCNKSYRRIPLQGICDCGGEILMSYHGSASDKVLLK